MANQPEPDWKPISALPMFTTIIDGMLADTQEQYETLLPAKEKPLVLDDEIVVRVLRLYETQRDDFWLFEEQFARWQQTSLTTQQQQEVTSTVY